MLSFEELLRILNLDESCVDDEMRNEIIDSAKLFWETVDFYEKGGECTIAEIGCNENLSEKECVELNALMDMLDKANAESVYVGTCTLGKGIDDLLSAANSSCDYVKIMVYDTLSNFLVSDMHCKHMDNIKSEYMQRGLHLTTEYAPGTNIELSIQKNLFSIIKTDVVTLTPDLLMYPKKSLSYIFGLTKTPQKGVFRHDCSVCHAKNCRGRQNKDCYNRLTVRHGNNVEHIDVLKGTNMLTSLREWGYELTAPCGGRGSCGKCKVKIVSGNADIFPSERTIFSKDELDEGMRLACLRSVDENMEIVVLSKTAAEISVIKDISVTGFFDKTHEFSTVVDIGSTTVAMALVDETAKKVVDIVTSNNPQSKFGGDVITRIEYAKNGGAKQLQDEIVTSVNLLIKKLINKYGHFTAKKLTVSANTTMLHLFFGRDSEGMAGYPYTPNFLESISVTGDELGITDVDTVKSFEGLSAFVGADIMSGIYYLTLPKDDKWKILVDLGTNAEIALFSHDKMYCTAAASGPAFEGANISCGMGATDGAICEVNIVDGKLTFATIGGGVPVGICGTGLVDIICALRKLGVIDSEGAMECDNYHLADGVFLSQKDVREFQVAKSAVRSGIDLLMDKYGVNEATLDAVCISGGFAKNINIDNAVFCGLLPEKIRTKTFAVGNSSLAGAIKATIENGDYKNIVTSGEYIDMACDETFFDRFVENIALS